MDSMKSRSAKRLTERMVRNEDIFCSLLFDSSNRTLRVVDFRGGNFQAKHNYLERVLTSEGMRKVFTLIERDDMTGWQRVGYVREGSIPGYYKRSDAYIMSKVYDAERTKEEPMKIERNVEFINDLKTSSKALADQKPPMVKVEQIEEETAVELVRAEIERLTEKGKAKKTNDSPQVPDQDAMPPVFNQFSREVEFFHFAVTNKRTKQVNIIGAEYQDCFGNAKLEVLFSPSNKADQSLIRAGVVEAIDQLAVLGAVSVFSLVCGDDVGLNNVFASAGFRSTGWMARQFMPEGSKEPVDAILWTKKLI